MDAPGRPHVRIYAGDIYIERVPNAWVCVVSEADWKLMDEPARNYMISKALKKGLDCSLPLPKTGAPPEEEPRSPIE